MMLVAQAPDALSGEKRRRDKRVVVCIHETERGVKQSRNVSTLSDYLHQVDDDTIGALSMQISVMSESGS